MTRIRWTRWASFSFLAALTACATAGPPVGDDVMVVPEGTEISATLEERVSPDVDEGETINARITEPVMSEGRELVPEGAEIRGRVTAVQRVGTNGDDFEDASDVDVVKLDFNEIEVDGDVYPVRTTITEVNPDEASDTDAGEVAAAVGAGAVAGAVLGRIIGGDEESTLIGAAVGAAAGTAIVLGTRDRKMVLPEGSMVRLRLDTPLRVRG